MARQTVPIQRYKGEMIQPRRPLWLPAHNYYVLTAAAGIGVFFLAWGVMQDAGEPTPWIFAGLLSSTVPVAAVLLREVYLRGARNRFRANQRRLDRSLHGLYGYAKHRAGGDKLTIEKNALILAEIKRKSEAANVLGRFAEGHLEVVDMCTEYIAAAERELPTVGAGSPRIAALTRGKDAASEAHHFHMLKWAEIESRMLTQEANSQVKSNERLETARKALGVLDFALNYYPHETALVESRSVLSEFVASIKLSQMIERAERATLRKNSGRALRHYRDALQFLERQKTATGERSAIAEQIEAEILRIEASAAKADVVRGGTGVRSDD